MNGMITALTASGMSWGDRLSTAGIVTLEGMAVIFVVLALLWGVIEIMHKFLYRAPETAKTASEAAPAETDTAVEESAETADDGAVVAAIIAAITAMRGEQGQTGGFRVVSFRRTNRN